MNDPLFAIANGIAAAAIAGKIIDETGGADSYFALTMKTPPYWTKRATYTYNDGFHSFWRVELPDPSSKPVAPSVKTRSPADALNDAELNRIQGVPERKDGPKK